MEKFRVYGVSTKEESQRELNHKKLARRAAAEGMVLLKNDNVLPLENKNIALYGAGSRMTVKGGSGSGDVHERHSVTIEEGLKNAGFNLSTTLWMDRFENKYKKDVDEWRSSVEEKIKGFSPIQTMKMFDTIHECPMPYPSVTPILEDELTSETDTAIYVLARQAGEGGDRRFEKGDYLLSDIETESLTILSKHYSKLILVINCGSIIDLSILDNIRIDAVIFYAQGGMEGGNAFADIVSGKAVPCGKLTDTWAKEYKDYPSSDTFSHINGNTDYENYFEGIYVGYRYFSTFGIKPRFPFGYGLSYTDFDCSFCDMSIDNTDVTLKCKVKNIGEKYSAKEIVQVYASKPQNNYDTEKLSLCSFGKTKLLAPNETEELCFKFNLRDLSCYDEQNNQFILDEGRYGIYIGKNVNDVTPCAVIIINHSKVIETVKPVCNKNLDFMDMKSNLKSVRFSKDLPRFEVDSDKIMFNIKAELSDAKKNDAKIDSIINRLTVDEKIKLVVGGGYKIKSFNNVMGAAGTTNTKLLKKGIPNIVLADGPAGLNVNQSVVVMKDGTPRYPDGLPEDWKWGWLKKFEPLVKAKPGKGRPVYQFMTAWPNATLQAQTWDTELLEEIGEAVGKEMLEIGVSVWLAPGLNIHRNPLCGRNFEYYSEDPLISGKMAAAITKGVQKCGGVGVTIKHFCCNNQEENRTGVSENVSQRALREIYLRGFRIVVTESNPWTIMTSYNKVNDVYTPNSYDLCTEVLRNEWGFDGVVMSDWNSTDQCSHSKAIMVGNDMIMPGNKWVAKAVKQDYDNGKLPESTLNTSIKRILNMIFNSATTEGF